MSDRRPEKLYEPCEVCGLFDEGEHFDQAGDWCDGAGGREVDPVAAVRRGVESGTIEGTESGCIRCEGKGKEQVKDRVWDGDELPEPRVMRICPDCKGSGRVLVIPIEPKRMIHCGGRMPENFSADLPGEVSDGGSET